MMLASSIAVHAQSTYMENFPYEFGGGDHLASSRSQLDWFLYQAGMLSFRAFAGGKATVVVNIRGTEIKTSSPAT
jgi:hypothetical protein